MKLWGACVATSLIPAKPPTPVQRNRLPTATEGKTHNQINALTDMTCVHGFKLNVRCCLLPPSCGILYNDTDSSVNCTTATEQ